MPVCFQLYRINCGEEGPVDPIKVDEELCKHFNQPIDEHRYLAGWYDSIGLRLALGKTWDEIRDDLKDHQGLLKVANYLEEHFQVNSFRSMR